MFVPHNRNDWIRLFDKQRLPWPKKVKKEVHNAEVECDSDFEDNYQVEEGLSDSEVDDQKLEGV